ncbi:MAG: 2-amino-4-hydroxy-6-hydroxymethyldihydropteridine diphosphokinase [Magnetococcales bacterium]|nr:2-amino-4-hydroxy-6-hydroxymethyldihydropteridine diphosphokinase [Magnetococcales bacterium]
MSTPTPSDASSPPAIQARIAWIGLGGNRPDSPKLLRCALERLRSHPGVTGLIVSPFYLTEPVGPVRAQPWFLNAVAAVTTTLGPGALLRLLTRIETRSGRNRQREVRWGPRPLDLDLLFHGARRMRSKRLTIPHPRLHARRFVLQPMADLAPEWIHPESGKTIDTLLREVDDTARIVRWHGRARTP